MRRLLALPSIRINSASTEDGSTPLYIACQNGHLSVVEALLEVPDIGKSSIEQAVRANEWLTHTVDVNIATTDGTTPLHVSCFKGHQKISRLLIEKGANVNCNQNQGGVPLHYACHNGDIKTVKLLVQHGAKLDAFRSNQRGTALMLACQKGHLSVVKALINAGADVNVASQNGTTALYRACQNGHLPVVKA